jgi:WD40 repeat protein/predicted Ser/Thr protein kinase
MSGCPSLAALEESMNSGRTDGPLGEHVAQCAACRAAVDEIRANAAFLDRFRAAGVAGTAGRTSDPGVAPGPEAPVAPDLVSGYEIQEEIHRGGQGVVYRAIQTQTQRTVAIKMLLGGAGASERQRERFEREVRIAASLQHPNIVTIYDSGAIPDGRFGLAMEFIDGRPLDEWSRALDRARGREARKEALRRRLAVMVKVCDAVLCAHQHSVVHRDLKPANILVDRNDEPHILDFGIARDTGQHTRLTHTGEFAGTLAYASPEQVSGDLSRVDTRTDIYSLGVILYEVVSGRMPYPVDGPFALVIRNIEAADPLPLPRHTRDPDGPWVDAEVSTIILKALAKDPARRYPTVAGLRNDLQRYLAGEAIEARRDSTWYVIRKAAARHRYAVSAATLFFFLLAGFAGAMAWQASRLAAALASSNIERGRLMAAGDDPYSAALVVWPELLRSTRSLADISDGFSGPPRALHAYWAMWDIYRRFPLTADLALDPASAEIMWFGDDARAFNVVDFDGHLWSWETADWTQVSRSRLMNPPEGVRLHGALCERAGILALMRGGAIGVFDVRDGRRLAWTLDPDGLSTTGVFSPDGSRLVTIGADNRIRSRDARSLDITWTSPEPSVCLFHPATGQYCEPAVSPDGTRIAAARPDGSVGLWCADSGELLGELAMPPSAAYFVAIDMRPNRIAFADDGRTLAAAIGTLIAVWPGGQGPPITLARHSANLVSLRFAPGNADRLYSCARDAILVLWNVPAAQPEAILSVGVANPARIAITPDEQLVAFAVGRQVRVAELRPEPHRFRLCEGSGPSSAAAIDPSGSLVAVVPSLGADGRQDIAVFDLAERRVRRTIRHEGARITGLAFSPDGRAIYAGGLDGRVGRWDVGDGRKTADFLWPLPEPPVVGGNQMALSPDGAILVCAGDLGILAVWETASDSPARIVHTDIHHSPLVDFGRDGSFATIAGRGRCEVWDAGLSRRLRSFEFEGFQPTGIRTSPDGRTFAMFGSSYTLRRFDIASGDEVFPTLFGGAGVALVYHPSGDILIGAGQDKAIRLWDTRSGRELISLRGHEAPVTSVLLTPDGRTLVSVDLAGTALVWNLAHYAGSIEREMQRRAAPRASGARSE